MGGEVEIGFGGVWAMGVDIGSKIIDADSNFPHKSGAGRHPFRGKSYWGDHCSASERFVALKSKGVAAGLKYGAGEEGGGGRGEGVVETKRSWRWSCKVWDKH